MVECCKNKLHNLTEQLSYVRVFPCLPWQHWAFNSAIAHIRNISFNHLLFIFRGNILGDFKFLLSFLFQSISKVVLAVTSKTYLNFDHHHLRLQNFLKLCTSIKLLLIQQNQRNKPIKLLDLKSEYQGTLLMLSEKIYFFVPLSLDFFNKRFGCMDQGF